MVVQVVRVVMEPPGFSLDVSKQSYERLNLVIKWS
jgi:hypothetical protein